MKIEDLKIGSRVIVRAYPWAGVRVVDRFLNQFFYLGSVRLDRPVEGVFIWHAEDLDPAPDIAPIERIKRSE